MIKNKILVITGMHFSGASGITQWLNNCGLQVGDELEMNENAYGFRLFEDTDFSSTHKTILNVHRLPVNGFTSESFAQLNYEERDRLKGVIGYKNSMNQQWGWKDPRTVLFLDTYRQLIPDAFYLVTIKNYQSVIDALIFRMFRLKQKKYLSRSGIGKFIWNNFHEAKEMEVLRKKYTQHYLKVWIAYNQAILQHVEKLSPGQYLVAKAIDLPGDHEAIFKHLTEIWAFSLRFTTFNTTNKKLQPPSAFHINSYIKDKSLLARADEVQQALGSLSILNQIETINRSMITA